jgi:hypothetical protein
MVRRRCAALPPPRLSSWLTLRSLFATAATSRRANAQMRREFDEMADRFQDELDEVRAKPALQDWLWGSLVNPSRYADASTAGRSHTACCAARSIDPLSSLLSELRFAEVDFPPRLFFSDPDLWTTALKLKAQLQHRCSSQNAYVDAALPWRTSSRA